MPADTPHVDVLCAGHACFDMFFSLDHHPAPDEKAVASALTTCGGGPAANAAVGVARLGLRAAFAGYLGDDLFGRQCLAEFRREGVDTALTVTGGHPTPLSAILVKPDGRRTVVNHHGDTPDLARLPAGHPLPSARVLLMDGHQPEISLELVDRLPGAVTVLDAGSLHRGTRLLMGRVDHVVASQKFARQFGGCRDDRAALERLAAACRSAVVTLGERGLIWKGEHTGSGRLAAFEVTAVDTTGAGDAFHAAFCVGIARALPWPDLLRFASAVGALACSQTGARPALPNLAQVAAFLQKTGHDDGLAGKLAALTQG